MADTKASALSAASALTGTELWAGVQSAGDVKITAAQVLTYVMAAIVDSAPGTLDTLNELAAALGDDPNFATTMATALSGKLAAASNLSDVANAGTARTNLGLAIGTSVQAYDADLAAIAGLTSAADKLPYFTGSGTAALADLTTAGRALIDDADAAAMRATLKVKRTIASGRWFVPGGINSLYATNVASGADSIRLLPGEVREKITLTGLGARIATAAASGNFQMAIYASDATTNFPTGAPLASTSSQSTTSTGGVEVTGLSVVLEPGLYWFALICDTTAATAVFHCAGVNAMDSTILIGRTTAALAIGGTTSLAGYSKSHTFGTWPTLTGNDTTDSLSAVNAVSIPIISFKS